MADHGRRLDDHRRQGARGPRASATSSTSRSGTPTSPPDRRAHTSELVSFDDLAGARVAIIGGRQSAYEWAALLCDHGAEQVDVVHRHPTPDVRQGQLGLRRPVRRPDAGAPRLVARPAAAEQQAIAREFWQVGRLTLEPWLVPRLDPDVVTSHPGCDGRRRGGRATAT